MAAAAEYYHIAFNAPSPSTNSITLNVQWTPPLEGWWKLNSDGACSGNPGPFAIGGIIRNQYGNWISGFSGFIGFGSALKAELWVISNGIKLASDLGCTQLWIETDSLLACNLLIDQSLSNLHEYWNIISFCRSYLQKFSSFRLSHTFRQGNQCADQLAKHCLLPCVYPCYPPPTGAGGTSETTPAPPQPGGGAAFYPPPSGYTNYPYYNQPPPYGGGGGVYGTPPPPDPILPYFPFYYRKPPHRTEESTSSEANVLKWRGIFTIVTTIILAYILFP
ncbi:reverse transcriptase [Senna tora]|uniref:Reverse transcriptase n=1 Tax=Senna tora TaxID=362788 RepID=A0A834TSN4_9FABA|nr:reverse transcriptase [Senna tora]